MFMNTLRGWLGVEKHEGPEHAPLRDLVQTLDRMEPDRARHLARFAYLLGRVAVADRDVSTAETQTDEAVSLAEESEITASSISCAFCLRTCRSCASSTAPSCPALHGLAARNKEPQQAADYVAYERSGGVV